MLVTFGDVIDLDVLSNALHQLCSPLILLWLPIPTRVRSRILPTLRELHQGVWPIGSLKGGGGALVGFTFGALKTISHKGLALLLL